MVLEINQNMQNHNHSCANSPLADFATRLIAWQKVHGRHALPWQNTQDPYAIWVSEIMLQQTQVAAVIGYYSKFMTRFPSIAALANASQDEVLQHWSGLGYYSRARNLHQAAITIMQKFYGIFPENFEAMQTLSGIGRTTAAAIAAFAFHQKQTILDGNVKRVLTRHFLIEGWSGTPIIEKKLWQLAQTLLPEDNMVAYTQGLMDLGATVCTKSKPKCYLCPHMNFCQAYQEQRVHELPTPKPRKTIPLKETTMLVLIQHDKVLLEKRPNTGIWGGLLSFPEVNQIENIIAFVDKNYGLSTQTAINLPEFIHTFTHFKLRIKPVKLYFSTLLPLNMHHEAVLMPISEAINAGIAAPIRKILQSLNVA